MTTANKGQLIGAALLATAAVATQQYQLIPLAVALGSSLGGIAGNLYDTATADDTVNRQQQLADVSVQTSTLGTVLPMIWGSCGNIAGNIFWAEPSKRAVETERDDTPSSGKGGGPRVITITTHYLYSFAIGLGDTRWTGPLEGLTKIYADGTLFWDGTFEVGLPEGWVFYSGAADQAPPDLIESYEGSGNLPGFRYRALVTVEDFNCGPSGHVPNFTFDIRQTAVGTSYLGTLLVNPSDESVWLQSSSDQVLWRFDPVTLQRTAVIDLDRATSMNRLPIFPMVLEGDDPWIINTNTGVLYQVDAGTNTPTSQHDLDVETVGATVTLASELVLADGDWWMVGYRASEAVNILYRMPPGGAAIEIEVGRTFFPHLIVDTNGLLWVSAETDGTVQRIDPASNTVTATLSSLGDPGALLIDTDGDLWIASDGTATSLFRYTTAGTPTLVGTLTVGPIARLALANDGTIWGVSNDGVVLRVDPGAMTATSRVVAGIAESSMVEHLLVPAGASGMWVSCRNADIVIQYDSSLNEVTRTRTAKAPFDLAVAANNGVWVSCREGATLQRIAADGSIESAIDSGNTLPRVISTLCQAAGLTTGQIDVTRLDRRPIGMLLVAIQAVRAPLEQLLMAYRSLGLESQGVLRFQPIGYGEVVATIPEADSAAGENDADPDGWQIARIDPTTIPTEVEVAYIDATRDFARGSQRFHLARPDSKTATPRTVQLPLTLMPQEAKQLAQELAVAGDIQRQTFSGSVSRTYAYLEPGDRVSVERGTLSYPLMLTDVSYGDPGILEVQAVPDVNYAVGAVGASAGVHAPTAPPVRLVQAVSAYLLNLPSLHATDIPQRMHWGVVGEDASFAGAALYRSTDEGASYQQVDQTTLQALRGTVALATASASYSVLDTVTTITVVLAQPTMTLPTITDDQLYRGENLCIVGSEIFSYATATLVQAGTYTLSRLLRGRRGTEHTVGTHATNEIFYKLDPAIRAIPLRNEDRFTEYLWKCVPAGGSLADAVAFPFTATAANLEPWSPIYINAVRNVTDWDFFWYERARFFGPGAELTGISHDIDFVCFELDIFTDATYATVVRSILTDGDNPFNPNLQKHYNYSASDETADFGSHQTTLYYRLRTLANTTLSVSIDYSGI